VRWAQPKLVLVSSIGSLSLARAEAEAFDCYLTKPVRHDELMTCIANALGQHPTVAPGRVEPATPVPSPRLKGHVLLVEDNPVNQVLACETLMQAGATVEVAANGLDGFAMAEAHEFDVILMDVQMPVLDGYGSARRIRQLAGRQGRVPIIAMTANAMSGDRERCLEAGMDDYISKPIDPDLLIVSLRRWLTAADDEASRPLVGKIAS
jgi:two-component system, sensor histidine kinase and response regulator